MSRFMTLALLVVTVSLVQTPANADLKCGDAPFPFNQKDLIVTWVGPMPTQGKVSFTDGKIFREMAEVSGPEIPRNFPTKYVEGLREVELFNASISWTVEELIRLQKRYEIPMEQEPIAIFHEYISSGYTILSVLVEHPDVIDPSRYLACSVVLQRGVIVYDGAEETLFLRSYFHSAKDSENFVNFVPSGGIKVNFRSDTIWFPLKLTKVIFEPASYVVLDILTPEPLDTKQLPTPFRVETAGQLAKYLGKEFYVTRITAKLESNKDWTDLRLKPPGSGLRRVIYTPRIVPPGEISAVAMLEVNCVSGSLKIASPGRHTSPNEPLKFDIDLVAQLWCRDADPNALPTELGTKIPPVSKRGLKAKDAILAVETFVRAAIESRDPMDTGRWIIAAEAGHLLTQLKQTIKKAYRILGNSSATARKNVGAQRGHIVDDVLLFEAAAIELDSLGQTIREKVLKNEYYDQGN